MMSDILNNSLVINYGLPILGFAITFLAQIYIKITYSKYKAVRNSKKNTGYDVARKILDENGLKDILVLETEGELTDHYDPDKRVIKLSTDIYHGDSIASASVAAHECGHAIQDKENYTFLRIRHRIVPLVNFSTKIGYIVLMIGLIMGAIGLATVGLVMLMAMLVFQLVTLPVEFNASNRAKKQIDKLNLMAKDEQSGVKTMLFSAALTYVASLASTLFQILRLALIVNNRRNNK